MQSSKLRFVILLSVPFDKLNFLRVCMYAVRQLLKSTQFMQGVLF